MKKKTSTLAVTIVILGLVWVIAMVAYNRLMDLYDMCWGSLTCVALAILAAECYLLVFRKDPGEAGEEPGALGVILTVCFLLITVLLNSVFALLDFGGFGWLLVTLNIMLIGGYFAMLLWVEQSNGRLMRQLNATEYKTAPSVNLSRKLGDLLAITEDEEVRDRLLKLKEAVDYSTNISTRATEGKELQMGAQLDELAQLIIARADQMIILNKLESAERIWKMRSSTASSVR